MSLQPSPVEYLRGAWEELRDVRFEISAMPLHDREDGIPRWRVDHAAQHGPGLVESLGAEEHPGDVHQHPGRKTEQDQRDRARTVVRETLAQEAFGG